MKKAEDSPLSIPELVAAAQIAGADESQDFWGAVADQLANAERHRAELVRPRRLTDAPKLNTV